ncbi:hypothetical protein QQS21_004752 [Conoideocrella luteorostrata]|uniref:laccase n=1 Tax=Conoideocrella luteorostrata TaxID=1105319 RepID=A0AAJ0CQY1_9HYPO|nr:hypothetical protein QQS21_004752 [Conoideocrella luteorostrata]
MFRHLFLHLALTASLSLGTNYCNCKNTANDRSSWCGYSVATDYENEVLDTGITREYYLELKDGTVAPDGVPRYAMTINGSIPGPTLFADWGDTVVIHVTNSLTQSTNGTTIHWHGIRQNYTNQNDGVPSITQCPVPRGRSMTYKWKATQYGSTWYHSHLGLQAWDGVFGGIIINGPATANYDEDLGMVFLNDWGHRTMDEQYTATQINGPVTLENGLINGTNVYTSGNITTGSRLNVSFTPGKSYRMRLVNAAIDNHFKFSIDNHTMKVIASDLVPIRPYDTTVLDIGMGQRYDIIVTANQASIADSFWMRAIPQTVCGENGSTDNIRGIVNYGNSKKTPATSGYSYTNDCGDETRNIVPFVQKTVGPASSTDRQNVTLGRNPAGLFRWYLNSTTMVVDWGKPTLRSILNGPTNYNASAAVFETPKANQWVYFVVETNMPIPHPIHLHGHDFYVLAQGTGNYSSSVSLNTVNPARRDTAMLPSAGYLVMAWITDNPGVWLMHCHIGWHTTEGFAVQFVERKREIPRITNRKYVQDVCNSWNTFQNRTGLVQEDSGV